MSMLMLERREVGRETSSSFSARVSSAGGAPHPWSISTSAKKKGGKKRGSDESDIYLILVLGGKKKSQKIEASRDASGGARVDDGHEDAANLDTRIDTHARKKTCRACACGCRDACACAKRRRDEER